RRSIPSSIAPPNSPVPRNATLAIADLPVESTPVPRVRRTLTLIVLLMALGPARGGRDGAGPNIARGELVEPRAHRSSFDRLRMSVSTALSYAPHYRDTAFAAVFQPRVLRWAGDPEGGAPFVEADPSHPDRVVGFDVEIAALLAGGVGRTPEFLNITFTSIDQSIARGDAEVGLSGIEDT